MLSGAALWMTGGGTGNSNSGAIPATHHFRMQNLKQRISAVKNKAGDLLGQEDYWVVNLVG